MREVFVNIRSNYPCKGQVEVEVSEYFTEPRPWRIAYTKVINSYELKMNAGRAKEYVMYIKRVCLAILSREVYKWEMKGRPIETP